METVVQFIAFQSAYNDKLQERLSINEKFSLKYKLCVICLPEEMNEFEAIHGYGEYNVLNKIKKVLYWHSFVKYLKNKYRNLMDAIVQIQYVDYRFLRIIPFLKKVAKKVILTYWGSDLLRNPKVERMNRLFNIASTITFETEEMAQIFNNRTKCRYVSKIKYVNFGSVVIDNIDLINEFDISQFKKKYCIEEDKLNVVIGYNRDFNQQHLEIIKALKSSAIDFGKINIIIPWTYGVDDKDYRKKIEKELDLLTYVFIEDYLTDKETACLRKISNILLQLQTTDCLSSSMIENLYAENEVITGSWLPYGELERKGVVFDKVSKVIDVGDTLSNLLERGSNSYFRKKNKEILYDMLSWDKNINGWIELYE